MKQNNKTVTTTASTKRKHAILRSILLVLVALIIGFSVYSINAKNLMGDRLPMPLGFGASVVLSGSMESALSKHDLIFVKPTDRLYVDQIVVYQSGGSLVVHRIIAINGDEIITQGDANNSADDPIPAAAIKGEVVLAIPVIGLAVDFLRNPVIVFLILAAAIFLMERSFRAEKATERQELSDIQEEIKKLSDELKK